MRTRSKYAWALAGAMLLAWSQPAYPQETNSSDESQSTGWRKFSEARPAEEARPSEQPPAPAYEGVPSQLVLPAGTWIKIRVDQPLSSDHNQPGDQFTATLAQPLVVDGYVVAQRGQTVGGRITSVEKAGRIKGTSRLGIELTELSLVDGRQFPIRSELIEYSGDTSKGRDATAVATTTGMGAAIGAVADGGFGAGMGAIAGAAASAIGVLVTRGRATEVYPESVLTFRNLEPLTISTERAERAFLPVRSQDYAEKTLQRRATRSPSPSLYPPSYYPYYQYYWGSPWGYSPYSYGPSVYFYSGPRYYRSYGGYYGGGHRGRGRR